ncbi:hypothetical protein [Zooshikella sp. RANM57]|uniref:hypothetical protein n=1 Tax=Zooshikella sp. RANM57 TaxID=3425863 RepID=UPI003D6E5697
MLLNRMLLVGITSIFLMYAPFNMADGLYHLQGKLQVGKQQFDTISLDLESNKEASIFLSDQKTHLEFLLTTLPDGKLSLLAKLKSNRSLKSNDYLFLPEQIIKPNQQQTRRRVDPNTNTAIIWQVLIKASLKKAEG